MGKYFHDVKVIFNPRNLPGFQHEALCSCGWNAKVDTEIDAVSASDRHIKANGGGHYTVELAAKPVVKTKEPILIDDTAHPKLDAAKPETPKIPREDVLAKGEEIKEKTDSPAERANVAKAEPKVISSFDPAKTTEAKPASPVTQTNAAPASVTQPAQTGFKKLGQA